MLRAISFSLLPEGAWQKAATKPPHFALVLFVTLLPLMILTLAVEGYALVNFGEGYGEVGRRVISADRAIKYEVFYGVASLAVIFLGAALLKGLGESFNLKASYSVTFVLMAIAYTPIFLVRLLDAVPAVHTWICWAVGVALAMRILYHGVGWWLKPEQTKGFGLFIMCFIYVLVLSGLVHFAAVQVLHGRLLQRVLES
jgi:uncharacterized membrane protein YecN with MAPEG domain